MFRREDQKAMLRLLFDSKVRVGELLKLKTHQKATFGLNPNQAN
ncbi:hypothetical protein J2X29_003712 [Shewanella putrefaciens]|nr:hypothetical protein [Shewanella putrefaciens]